MARQKPREKQESAEPSRVEKLWEDAQRDWNEAGDLDLSYIDNLESADTYKDEFVRLPYETLARSEDFRWVE